MAKLTAFLPRLPRVVVQLGDFVLFALRRFYADGMGMTAGALTYSTLLALVPLMVITFAILSGFPAFEAARTQMEALFLDTLVPEVGAEVEDYLSRFSTNASNLTAVGIVGLAVTAVLLLSTIEATLNRVWRVERPRPMGVRLLIFWTILTLGPLLLGASFAMTSDTVSVARTWAGYDTGANGLGVPEAVRRTLFAIVAQSTAFTLLFKLVPARPVRLRDAALGGVIAGVGFQILRWAFNSFLTSGSTYDTIYGAVAVVPIFLLWLYATWTVIIFGAVFAAAFPDWWRSRDPLPNEHLSPARRLEVAVAILSALSRKARSGKVATQAELQETAPLDARDGVLESLLTAGYVVQTDDGGIVLSRDLHVTSVQALADELGLSLGLVEGDGQDGAGASVLSTVEEATGSLPALLRRLGSAEAEILARPIAEVIESAETLPGLRMVGHTGG